MTTSRSSTTSSASTAASGWALPATTCSGPVVDLAGLAGVPAEKIAEEQDGDDEAQEGSSLRVVVAALLVNIAIALFKFVAAALSRSTGMLAEALHSLADTGNQI